MMTATVLGYKARFCDGSCKQSFKEDRECGLNYGLHTYNGRICLHREEFSLVAKVCAYCGEHVGGKIPERLREKFGI